ncbi:MAG TPA: hypothetical protein VKU93_01380 [Terracidiphilus sp.]|nr:hypothetical protein [Terracidiphilus sp.]
MTDRRTSGVGGAVGVSGAGSGLAGSGGIARFTGQTSLLPGRPARAELWAVLAACAGLSLMAIVWSWTHGAMLNYGDAIAHLHIARRIFDSRDPGLSELGSVWLPLPHLLMLPFVQVYAWWANGIAGTIPSALAWLAACVGLYRLARHWMQPAAAALTLAFFALNPNLLYLQTTAMTEPLFVCEMIWVVLGLVEWSEALVRGDRHRLPRLHAWIALWLVAAIFTRYDGWIMALIAWSAMGAALLRRGQLRSLSFWIWSAVLIAAPAAWLAYNAVTFGDWLDFARGPYSAKAIELRTAHGAENLSVPLHPGWHNPWVALLFYVKAAEMDALAAWRHALLALSVLGTLGAWLIARRRGFAWALLLWLPLPFYAYSVSYGWVPIFVPVWWPHSWYNTRYGMELLPAIALGLGLAAQFWIAAVREFKPRWARYAAGFIFVLAALNAWGLARRRPLVYVEGTLNAKARAAFDGEIPPAMRAMLAGCPGGEVLMNTSVHPELVAMTGIPLRQTINESDREVYREALASPARHAALVLAFAGDEIDAAVKAHPEGLRIVARVDAKDQPEAALYVSGLCSAR